MKRPGYYVEGRWYADRFHQARARAIHLRNQYSRPVEVRRLNPDGSDEWVLTVH